MDDAVAFASREHFGFLSLLLFARGADFLSTWVATPNLALEANPIARKLGWTWGSVVNLGLCVFFGLWPLIAVIVATTSTLVAARNFQHAWLMRCYGEENYRAWFLERLEEAPPTLYLFCLLAQTFLTALIGGALMYFSDWRALVPLGIGLGILGYALAVVVYTLLGLWRHRRASRGK